MIVAAVAADDDDDDDIGIENECVFIASVIVARAMRLLLLQCSLFLIYIQYFAQTPARALHFQNRAFAIKLVRRDNKLAPYIIILCMCMCNAAAVLRQYLTNNKITGIR